MFKHSFKGFTDYKTTGSTMHQPNDNFKNKFKNFSKNFKNILLILGIIFALASYYILLFPINLRSPAFYNYFLGFIIFVGTIHYIDSFSNPKSKKIYKFCLKLVYIFVIFYLISFIIASPILRAKSYANLIDVKEGDFANEVKEANFNTLPVVDRSTAIKLGSRKMGEAAGNLVSQYDIDDTYSQINVNGKPIRVTPLVYSGVIKWFNNFRAGIPYYIEVDMTNQNAKLVKPSSPIKYSFSDKFSRNILRHLRFRYPTAIFEDINFEIDDEGNPYWIASISSPTIGIFSGKDIKSVVIANACTGETKKYSVKDTPPWVDRVYPAEMIIKQLTDNGKYKKGYLNSVFAQEGVTKPTDGYNYLSMGTDIYIYTGITSVLEDQSNIGFVFSNTRTKDTRFYRVSSAEEYSIMSSAQGAVQEKNYIATFPILINLNGRPTYFLALKDNADLTKMYALVDAQSYQNVATGTNISNTVANFKKIFADSVDETETDWVDKKITIKEIIPVVIEGNTVYIIKATNDDNIYTASINVSNEFAFYKPNDTIKVSGVEANGQFVIKQLK